MGPTENRDHGYLPRGVGWYRRTVTAAAVESGGSAMLHFEGAYRDTTVFLDGRLTLHHLSGCKTPQTHQGPTHTHLPPHT